VTDLPQLVALFHSFVGVAATVTCIGNFMVEHEHFLHDPSGTAAIKCALFLGAYIGGVTATGSLMAYGKLQGYCFILFLYRNVLSKCFVTVPISVSTKWFQDFH
jgi:NAD/NADP transhydrogenase beta subunit